MHPDTIAHGADGREEVASLPIYSSVAEPGVNLLSINKRLDTIEQLLNQHTEALNSIGTMLNAAMEIIGGVVAQFQGQSPAQMIRGLFGGR